MWHTRVITKQSKQDKTKLKPTRRVSGVCVASEKNRETETGWVMDPSPCNCWNHFTKPPSPTPSSSSEVWKDLKLSSLCDSSMEMEASSPWLSLCPASSVFQKQSHQHHSMLSSFNTSFDASSSSGEKIAQQDRVYAFSDQRRKRILKNRESALRSRARKQVSTLFPHSLHLLGALKWKFYFI